MPHIKHKQNKKIEEFLLEQEEDECYNKSSLDDVEDWIPENE